MTSFDRIRRQWSLELLVLLICLCGSSPVFGAEPLEFPPIGVAAHIEHHQGKVIWADLVTPDLAAAESFYGGLFGWTFQGVRHGESDYAVAYLDGRAIAGLLTLGAVLLMRDSHPRRGQSALDSTLGR